MPHIYPIFNEDIVYQIPTSKTKKQQGNQYGLVLDNGDTDDESYPRKMSGKVRVAWHPHGKESVLLMNKLKVVDRSLIVGDVIQLTDTQQSRQKGTVTGANVVCNLRVLGTNKYIYNVDTRSLAYMEEFDIEHGWVSLDSWIGSIDQDVVSDVTLVFHDGARCLFKDAPLDLFDDVNDNRQMDSQFQIQYFYVNQELHCQMSDLSTQSVEWLNETSAHSKAVSESKPRLNIYPTVEKVEMKKVEVYWDYKGLKGDDAAEINSKMVKPPTIVQGDDLLRLKTLDTFSHTHFMLGDSCYYTLKHLSEIQPKNGKIIPHLMPKPEVDGKVGQGMVNGVEDGPLVNSASATGVSAEDVANAAEGAASCNAVGGTDDSYIDIEEDEEPQPAQKSRKKRGQKKGGASVPVKAVGANKLRPTKPKKGLSQMVYNVGDRVPVEIMYTWTSVNVTWQDGRVDNDIPSTDLCPEDHLDETEFFPGDFVTDSSDTANEADYCVVVKADHSARTVVVRRFRPYKVGETTKPEEVGEAEEVSAYEVKEHPEFGGYRAGSYVVYAIHKDGATTTKAGQITHMNSDGTIDVRNADGQFVVCYPQDICHDVDGDVDDDDDDFSDGSYSDSGNSWETEEEESVMDAVSSKSEALEELIAKKATMTSLLELLQNFALLLTSKPNSHKLARILQDCKALVSTNNEVDQQTSPFLTNLQVMVDGLSSGNAGINMLAHEAMTDVELKSIVDVLAKHVKSENAQLPVKTENGIDIDNSDATNSKAEVTLKKENGIDIGNSATADIKTEVNIKTENVSDIDNSATANIKAEIKTPAVTVKTDKSVITGDSSASNNIDKQENNIAPPETGTCNGAQPCSCEHHTKTIDMIVKICYEMGEYVSKAIGMLQTAQDIIENRNDNDDDDDDYEDVDDDDDDEEKNGDAKAEGVGNGWIDNALADTVTDDTVADDTVADDALADDNFQENASIMPNGAVDDNNCAKPDSAKQNGAKPKDRLNKMKDPLNDSMDKGIRMRYGEVPSTPECKPNPSFQFLQPFEVLTEVPPSHTYICDQTDPTKPRAFMSSVKKELSLLKSSLPDGILVRAYEQRLDLFSVMICGPLNTPYEDGLFFFDVQLPPDYPSSPPLFHYLSYCKDRLNPNLYEDGKVCVSLLGTWSGKGSEQWTPRSTLLQVLISIQGLILVSEPYYNEAGFEKFMGSEVTQENSKMYNEMALIKLIQSMSGIVQNPHIAFAKESQHFCAVHLPRMIGRVEKWIRVASEHGLSETSCDHSDACNCPNLTNDIPSANSVVDATNNCVEMAENCDSKSEISDSKTETHDSKTETLNSQSEMLDSKTKTLNSKSEIETKAMESIMEDCDSNNLQPKTKTESKFKKPDFPLLPLSRGVVLSLKKVLVVLKKALDQEKIDS